MDTLSNRGQSMTHNVSKLLEYFLMVQKNMYDSESNRNGICNCGVAENYLCENELVSKLQTLNVWKPKIMFYPDSLGDISFRKNLCRFFQHVFQLNYELDPNRMIVSSGLTGIISLISHLICDPNDVFLIAAPYYKAFDHDVSIVAKCSIYPCPLMDQDKGDFRLSVEIFQRGYDKAIDEGFRPRAIIIVNPSNPLGDIYDEQTIEPILKFASEKKLHVIVDEIYGLSIFENQPKFQSILNYTTIIDQSRTHFVWSFSKDFAISGLRLGVFYSGSNELCSSAFGINFIQIPSNLVQETLSQLISDLEWVDSYVKLNQSRLTQQYEYATRKLQEIDKRISIRLSTAGFFIWTDCRLLLHSVTFEEESRFHEILFDHGVYISSGSSLGCSEPGWFRFIFSVKTKCIDEAIKRFALALDVYRRSTASNS